MQTYRDAVEDLLERLETAEFEIRHIDDGGDIYDSNFINHIMSVDESNLIVRHRKGNRYYYLNIFIVLGNSLGEIVCDYTTDADLDVVMQEFYDVWEEMRC